MLNESIKNEFLELEESPAVRTQKYYIFLNAEIFEERFGKDLADFSREEVEEYIADGESGKANTIRSRLPYIRSYAKFYRKTINKPLETEWDNIKPSVLYNIMDQKSTKIQTEKPITRKKLLSMAKQLTNPRDAAVLVGVYEGIKGRAFDEFNEIRPEDVHEHSIYIKSRDEEVPVSDELIELFKEAMASTTYTETSKTRIRSYPLVYGNEVALKHLSTIRKLNARPFATSLIRTAEFFNAEDYLNATSLREWGMANYIIEKAKAHNISSDQALKLFFYDMKDQYDVKAVTLKDVALRIVNLEEKMQEESNE